MHNLVSVTSAPSNEHEKVSFRLCLTTEFVLKRVFIYVCSNVFQCIVRVSENLPFGSFTRRRKVKSKKKKN